MMAQSYPAPGMIGPGHPGMAPHGHPMGVPHPGAGHMGGQPGPSMMQGMHPGVSAPQVTQGPMVTGMPPGAGTPAPMQNGMAMAHLGGPQQHMFQQNPQMNIGQMQQMSPHQALLRQRAIMQQQANAAGMPMSMNMNNPHFQQMQMMKAMPMQQQLQMQNHLAQQQHQQQQQQRIMAAQAAQQAAYRQAAQNQHQAQQQHQQQQAQQQQQQQVQQQQAQQAQQAQQQQQQQAQQAAAATQQMQMSRSQEPTTQPPQSHPTPAPQNQPPPPQPQPNNQPPQQPPQQQPKPQPTPQPTQQQGTPAPSVKADGADEEPQIKQQDMGNQIMMQDIPKQQQQQQQNDLTGQCILQLLLYQDNLANPERPNDLSYWTEVIDKYFSPFGSIRQQLYNNNKGNDKSFQLQYHSLARFYYLHFNSGIKQILMQSFDHNQSKLPNGGMHIWSNRASLTYVFHNDLRVTTQGSLKVNFDDMQKIEHIFIATSGWTEYIPRHAIPLSFDASPKMTSKNAKKNHKGPATSSPALPSSPVNEYGVPFPIIQFLELAEVMTAMGPLMEYFSTNPGISPREALSRINNDAQLQQMRMQNANANANAMAVNGQVHFPQQRMGMNMPSQLQSPALQHLGLPHGQGSPAMGTNHTPSPGQNPGQGGVAMMHQMSAQGSTLSGGQATSTNTSPNVSNKRRRASGVKMEDENAQQDPNAAVKVKQSPRVGGKRQKGQP